MLRIYVRKPGHNYGRVYKSKSSVLEDKVAILGYIGFVATGFITEAEWAKSQQLIMDRFQLEIIETQMDGRGKVARYTPYFNWDEVIKSNHQKK